MIKKDFYEKRKDGVNLFRSYSTEGFYIVQNETGNQYTEAIDVEDSPYTYSEIDLLINDVNDEATEEDYISALENLGVNFNE